jgi:hypothetical protein
MRTFPPSYTTQDNKWLNAIQIMCGRLFKFGAQLTV